MNKVLLLLLVTPLLLRAFFGVDCRGLVHLIAGSAAGVYLLQVNKFKMGGATEKPSVVLVTSKSKGSDIQNMASVTVLFQCIVVIPVRCCGDGGSSVAAFLVSAKTSFLS